MLHAALWFWFFRFPEGVAPLLLRFSVGSGVDVLGSRKILATIPALAFLFGASNILFGLALRRRDQFLSYLFLAIGVLVQAFFLFALAILWFANRS